MQKLGYGILKGIVYGFSSLPFWVLHRISDGLFVLLYYTGAYRKGVVKRNLRKAFPDKSEKEISQITRAFFRHFCDIMVESMKSFTISEKQIRERHGYTNPEIMEELIRKYGRAAMIGPHYNNWEWWVFSANFILPKNPYVLIMYAKLQNAFMEKMMKQSRSRMGTVIFPKRETPIYLRKYEEEPFMVCFAADQAPLNSYNAYWMTFLGQETGVFMGPEKLAKKYNMPVVYGHQKKIGRSRYVTTLEVITEKPKDTALGEITEQHMKILEADIREAPEFWLWTHKRWKRQKPKDYEAKKRID